MRLKLSNKTVILCSKVFSCIVLPYNIGKKVIIEVCLHFFFAVLITKLKKTFCVSLGIVGSVGRACVGLSILLVVAASTNASLSSVIVCSLTSMYLQITALTTLLQTAFASATPL